MDMVMETITTNIETWDSICSDLADKGITLEDCEDYIEMKTRKGERVMTCALTGNRTEDGLVEVEIEAPAGMLEAVA